MIEILRAGAMSSVQDAGRPGLRGLGVTAGGALDPMSLALGNLLVGNPRDAAGIEISLPPAAFRFELPGRIALTGAELAADLDGRPVLPWWSTPVQSGQILRVRPAGSPGAVGMHSYLAVSGGVAVPVVLGARSTDLKSGFGGLEGRLLANGDRLPVGAGDDPDSVGGDAPAAGRPSDAIGAMGAAGTFGIRAPMGFWPRLGTDGRPLPVDVRFLPGPDWDDFSLVSRRLLAEETWEITPQSNRMGYRLSGPRLVRLKSRERDLLSHGVLPGVIQVPPDGQPIVLMADAQTTGGYPKIGVVVSADLPLMAQVRPGARVRFVACDTPVALQALRDAQAYDAQIADVIASRLAQVQA